MQEYTTRGQVIIHDVLPVFAHCSTPNSEHKHDHDFRHCITGRPEASRVMIATAQLASFLGHVFERLGMRLHHIIASLVPRATCLSAWERGYITAQLASLPGHVFERLGTRLHRSLMPSYIDTLQSCTLSSCSDMKT